MCGCIKSGTLHRPDAGYMAIVDSNDRDEQLCVFYFIELQLFSSKHNEKMLMYSRLSEIPTV